MTTDPEAFEKALEDEIRGSAETILGEVSRALGVPVEADISTGEIFVLDHPRSRKLDEEAERLFGPSASVELTTEQVGHGENLPCVQIDLGNGCVLSSTAYTVAEAQERLINALSRLRYAEELSASEAACPRCGLASGPHLCLGGR